MPTPRNLGNPQDAQLVRDAREELGLSQRQIGKLVGIYQPAVHNIEHQRRALTLPQRRLLIAQLAAFRAGILAGGGLNVWGGCDWDPKDPRFAPFSTEESAAMHAQRCHVCLAVAVRRLRNE